MPRAAEERSPHVRVLGSQNVLGQVPQVMDHGWMLSRADSSWTLLSGLKHYRAIFIINGLRQYMRRSSPVKNHDYAYFGLIMMVKWR